MVILRQPIGRVTGHLLPLLACAQDVFGLHKSYTLNTQYHILIPWLDQLAMTGVIWSSPICFEVWSNVILVVKSVDLKEVT